MPVLGPIFLRHADNRYRAVLERGLERIPKLDGKPLQFPRKEEFIGQAALFPPETAGRLPVGSTVAAIDF